MVAAALEGGLQRRGYLDFLNFLDDLPVSDIDDVLRLVTEC